MRTGVRNVLSVIVLASVAVAATGCSHETLGGASQDLNVTFTPSPAGAGRYTGFGNDKASFIVNKIQVIPADPTTAALYGTKKLLIRFTPFTADLTQTQDVAFSHIALSVGTYRVALIEVSPLALVDDNVAPNPATCIDGVAVIDGSRPPGQVPETFAFPDPPSLTFTVRPGQTKLALTVNVPGLIGGYESSYTCAFSVPGGFPRLIAFNEANFKTALLANLTLD